VSIAVDQASAVHDHRVHVDAVSGINHVGAPRVVALHAQRDRRSPVVVGRARHYHRQSHQRDETQRVHFDISV